VSFGTPRTVIQSSIVPRRPITHFSWYGSLRQCTNTVSPGWSTAKYGPSHTPGQSIYYKVAGAAEPTVVTFSGYPLGFDTRLGLHIYEYSGIDTATPLDVTDLADGFVNAYVKESGDEELRLLLNFYKCYRAYVRGKVGCSQYDDPYIPATEKDKILATTKGYFELAESYIEG